MIITPEMIPEKSAKANYEARCAFYRLGGKFATWDETNCQTEILWARVALAAWPGMECKNTCGSYPPFPHIILPFPLPKEISDA